MKRNRGSSLVQYAILLALMSIAVVGVYFAFGREINMILNKYLTMFTANNAAVEANAKLISDGANIKMPTGSLLGGSLGGTESAPIKVCANGSCTIDFGDYILQGIPENFGDFINSNSNSGGTEKLCQLIEQIADQLENSGDVAGADEFRKLANYGHLVSDVQKNLEDQARSCTTWECVKDKRGTEVLNIRTIPGVSENLPMLYSGIFANGYGGANQLSHALSSTGEGMQMLKNSASTFDLKKPSLPDYRMVEVFSQIKSNPKYSDHLKYMTSEIMRQINDVQSKLYMGYTAVTTNNGAFNPGFGDPVTGEFHPRTLPNNWNPGVEGLYKPDSSIYLDLSSSLICTSVNLTDIYSTCH